MFTKILTALFDENLIDLVDLFVSVLDKFDDLKYYFFKHLSKISTDSNKVPNFAIKVLLKLTLISPPTKTDEFTATFSISDSPQLQKIIKKSSLYSSHKAHKDAFSECWIKVLRTPSLGFDDYKQCLSIMHRNILPNLNDAALLIDFFTESYNKGGVVSVLALNGLMTLVTEYNLEYPDFYTKLYQLLGMQDLSHVKYRSRFFRLLEKVMASPNLPSSLVASFIKRLSSLTLTSPPPTTLTIIPLIYNLLIQNPSCLVLIHNPLPQPPFTDPFKTDELDPQKTNALESSLWELTSLKKHYLPAISSLAVIFEERVTRSRYDMEDFLDLGFDGLLKEGYVGDEVLDEGSLEVRSLVFV